MNTNLNRKTRIQFSWDKMFSNTDVNQKLYLFNQTIKGVLPNFILRETVKMLSQKYISSTKTDISFVSYYFKFSN